MGEKLENAAKADVVDFLKEEFEWRCALLQERARHEEFGRASCHSYSRYLGALAGLDMSGVVE